MNGVSPDAAGRQSKVVVLLRLLGALEEGRYSLDGLREKAAGDSTPSTRSLRRYLAALAEAGYPWYFDRTSGTYRFPDGYVLRKPDLSASEIAGLLTLRGIAGSLGRSLSAGVERLTDQFVAGTNAAGNGRSAPVRLHVAGVALDESGERVFEVLQTAQRNRQRVVFSYTDKFRRVSERRVDVYGFVISSGRIYAIGHDLGRNATRTFALDGVFGPRMLPQQFSTPGDFDLEQFAAHSISGVMSNDQLVDVTVRFSPVVARAAQAASVAQEHRILPSEDGSLSVVYRVADIAEIVRWTLGWGTEAEIIEPPHAREHASGLAETLAGRYRDRRP